MNLPCTVTTFLALYALVAIPKCAADGYSSAKDEISAAASWFDSLEWPDVNGKPYMEFTLAATKDEIRWSHRRQMRGFLFSEDEQAYRAFCDGTTRRIFKFKSPAAGKSGLPATAREVGPTAAVDDEIADLRRPKAEDGAIFRPYFRSEWIRTYTHIFVLARCFARQGRTDLTEKLDKALALAVAKRPVRQVSQEADFRVAIEKWIFEDLILESIHDFDDLGAPRTRLLEEFERIAHGFPGADKPGAAQKITDQLRTMIAEDEAHAKSIPPLEAMSQAEKVSELIFRLRDENGLQRSAALRPDWRASSSFIRDPLGPASLSIRGAPGPTGPDDSPARQLIRFGPAAVPALIEALGSPGLTRSVEIPENEEMVVNPSTAILTVGECADTILYYISGRHFEGDRGAPGSPRTAEQIEAARAQALQWWSEWQTKGEKVVLAEGVQRGDRESLEQACHLVALDPDAAVAALVAGIEAAKSADIRTDLIRELGMIKTGAATRALRDQMKSGLHLGGRIAAAAELCQRGEADAVPAMINEWGRWKPSAFQPPNDDDNDTMQLIDFLSSCGQTAAIKALDRRFASLPVETKFSVLQADSYIAFDEGTDRKPMPAEFEAVQENLLVKALDDTTRRFAMSTSRDGFSFSEPRVCDMAACALTDRWPGRYPFKWKQTLFERDMEIAGLRNAWRSARGLPALPAPKPPSPVAAAAGQDPNSVAACEWIGGPAMADIPISVGQPLTADGIIKTILYLHRNLPRDCFGFVFSAERDIGQSGIIVQIEWYHGLRPESPSHEACHSDLWLDEHSSAGLFPREGPKEGADSENSLQSRRMLDTALHRGLDQPVSFVCGWLWEKTLVRSPEMGPMPAPRVK